MAKKPCCLKCGSWSVFPDVDELNGRVSIYCKVCGNRQYRDTDYVGFEMREEVKMAMRGTCNNCERVDMSLPRQHLCGTCAPVSLAHPEPGPERNQAMAAVKERVQKGLLRRNPVKTKPSNPNPPNAAASEAANAALNQAGRKVAKLTKAIAAASSAPPPDPGEQKPVIIHLTFSADDLALFQEFQKICKRNRREPAAQILAMIDELVNLPSQEARP